ncbi:hypothetical protein PMKS-004146 [Pichia membranifaciens]|uniref:Kinesin motor domain-containing protein n=1 Tax=Pichia membranifaciens TaxID=4926 RepID=A0A1Q2YM19_9ASCO|nr:hypothetical protein PMKS-004146 [Pichia membranifaciens]
MEVHLALKSNPGSGLSPVFHRSKEENKIVFPKFETQFNFKSLSYPEEDIFTKVALPLLENKFFKDEDSLLITLGPTNSGKSHLLFQNENSLVDQSLRYIFDNIEPLSDNVERIRKYYPDIFDARTPESSGDVSSSSFHYLSVSMFELYNDNIIDLLHPNSKTVRENSTIVTDPIDAKLTPRNLSRCLVNSYRSVHDLVYRSLAKRKTFPTFANSSSSRSHCFIFLNLHKVYADVMETTRFTIADLAGLERSKSAGTSGLSLREASYTNGSLTELGRCFELISMKQFYKTCLRTNKLTRLVLNDYVKLSHPLCILVTLDPFGEEGLILQTLRYIDPIKYQHLQRKSLSKFSSRSKSINKTEQQSLIKEIDHLRQSQKLLKSKVHTLQEFVVENENKIRDELYQENEQTLAKLIMDHKEDINKLTQDFIYQTDKKLQDQSDSFRVKYEELQQVMNDKRLELETATKELEGKKLELEISQSSYSQLTKTLNELKFSNLEIIDHLKQELEESNSNNENLRIENETLTLKISEIESSQKEEIAKVEVEKSTILVKLEAELSSSKKKIADLEIKSDSLKKALFASEVHNEHLNEVQAKFEDNIESLQTELKNKEQALCESRTERDDELQLLKDTLSSRDIKLSALAKEMESTKKDYEQILKEKNELTAGLKLEIEVLEDKLAKTENENLKTQNDLQQLSVSSELTVESLNRALLGKEQVISELEEQKKSALEKFENSLLEKDSEIQLINAELEYMSSMSQKKISSYEKELELTKKENFEKLKESKTSYEDSADKFEKELGSIRSLLEKEVQKSATLKSDLEDTVKMKNEEIARLSEKSQTLSEAAEKLQSALESKSVETLNIKSTSKNAEEELAKLQLLCSDLKSELGEKEKLVEKYNELKSKSLEYGEFVKMLQSENQKKCEELKSKEAELESYVKKVERLREKIASSDVKYLSNNPSPEIHDALSLSGEQPIIKTPRKTLNILDTDPQDDVGLPSIMSSPLKSPSFHIHSDQGGKNNTIALGSTQLKKKKTRKLSKHEHLAHQKQNHERKMMESYDSSKSNKSSKFKFKALSNTNGSDLNRKILSSSGSKIDTKSIKKRKTLSPIKPSKKKVRRNVGGEDSFDLLE